MSAFIVAAARSLIAPKDGALKHLSLHALAAPVLRALGGAQQRSPDLVILGNALAAGGNPARRCSLAAFGETVPAITVDSQCCAGLDAIGLAGSLIRSGAAERIVAGGVESFSQAPLRARRTSEGPAFYTQAEFTPWPDRERAVLSLAQSFAERQKISRSAQEAYAIKSHAKAIDHQLKNNTRADPFTRALNKNICRRFPALFKDSPYAITAALVAPRADAAAALLLVDRRQRQQFSYAVELLAHIQVAANPDEPALGGLVAGQRLLSGLSAKERRQIRCLEIMESFAAQAIHTEAGLGFGPQISNAFGGLLAMGHPIGASGAVLVGNLFFRLQSEPKGSLGLAVIPSAGGLGSALLLQRQ